MLAFLRLEKMPHFNYAWMFGLHLLCLFLWDILTFFVPLKLVSGSDEMPVWHTVCATVRKNNYAEFVLRKLTFYFVYAFLASWNVNCIGFNLLVNLGWLEVKIFV